MRFLAPLLTAAALPVALAVTSGRLSAQAEDCTIKCSCIPGGCGCQSSGGNGSECTASGNGCFVNSCDEEPGGFLFAPDGSVLVLRTPAPGEATDHDRGEVRRVLSVSLSTAWEADGDGHAVARNCRGLVVAEYFDQVTAGELRKRSRRLVI